MSKRGRVKSGSCQGRSGGMAGELSYSMGPAEGKRAAPQCLDAGQGEGCADQDESFFSRLRRAEIGTHYRVSGRYLHCYAGEMAWRENNRRVSNGGVPYLGVTAMALNAPVSRQ